MSYLAVYKSISDDVFETYESSVGIGETTVGDVPVRRPMRGILLKEETYASLAVDNRVLHNSSVSARAYFTTNFLLQSVTETRNEKVQFVNTFGGTYAFFFGEQPRIINCAAVLLNTPDFNWEREWWANYEETLRGTSLTSSNLSARLEYDGVTIVGYLTNCTTIKSAQDPNLVQVNFSMFVESVVDHTDVGNSLVYKQSAETRADYLGVGNAVREDPTVPQESTFESTTADVRRANIKIGPLGPGGGKLSKLMGALSAIDSALTGAIRTARNALYGRNLVVPRSFVGENYSRPVFPEGTGADDLAGTGVTNFFGKSQLTFAGEDTVIQPGSSTVTLRSNTDGFLTTEYLLANQRRNGHTWNNFDEYVNRPPRSSSLEDLYADTIGEEWLGMTELGLTYLDIVALAEEAVLNENAVNAFKSFGLILNRSAAPYSGYVDPVTQYNIAKGQQMIVDGVRSVLRVGYGVATYFYGESRVNAARDLQDSITNPNASILSSERFAGVAAEMAATSAQQEADRAAAAAEADRLRGNTGTVSPSLLETVASIIL